MRPPLPVPMLVFHRERRKGESCLPSLMLAVPNAWTST